MKKLFNRLERGLMLALAVMPLYALITRKLCANPWFGVIWLGVQTFVVSLLALLPAFVGSYHEYDVIKQEGRQGNDPNPDRETVHVLVKEGHRFPIRLPVAIVVLVFSAAALLSLSVTQFNYASLAYKLIFAGLTLGLEIVGFYSASSGLCMWTEIPGMLLGFLDYLAIALYLKFSGADNSELNLLVSICSLVYLFFGGVCLNRQSLAISLSANGENNRRAPARIVRRNRAMVIGFSALVAAVSFLKPLRAAAVWLINKLLRVLKCIAWVLRGCQAVDEGDVDALIASQYGEATTEVVEEAETATDAGSMVIVYIFFGFVALGLLWIIYDGLKKLMKKLSALMEKFASGLNEGYYDEKEEIKDEDEARSRLSGRLKEGLKQLFARETPWDRLTGREKARRLLKEIYKKRGKALNGLKQMTAREALAEMKLSKGSFAGLYDAARYSERHEVSSSEMDSVRKELKP